MTKMLMLRFNIGSGSAEGGAIQGKGVPRLALFALRSWANAEHASAEPEPMLSLSILAFLSDLGQMKKPQVRLFI